MLCTLQLSTAQVVFQHPVSHTSPALCTTTAAQACGTVHMHTDTLKLPSIVIIYSSYTVYDWVSALFTVMSSDACSLKVEGLVIHTLFPNNATACTHNFYSVQLLLLTVTICPAYVPLHWHLQCVMCAG